MHVYDWEGRTRSRALQLLLIQQFFHADNSSAKGAIQTKKAQVHFRYNFK